MGQFITFDNVANIHRPSGEVRFAMAPHIVSSRGPSCVGGHGKEIKLGSYDIYIFGVTILLTLVTILEFRISFSVLLIHQLVI